MNPLLQSFETKFKTPPFDKIKNEHFLPALKKAVEDARILIGQIRENKSGVSFENTVYALEAAQEKIDVISNIFFNLHSAESNEELQKIAKEFSAIQTKFANDISLDESLFLKIKECYENRSKLCSDQEKKMLTEKVYKSFVRNGALLNSEDKIKLREIDEELSKTSLMFSDNVLAETNEFVLEITNRDQLKGLPEVPISAAKELAKEKGKPDSWLFTLHAPSFIPFVTYIDDRSLREKMFMAQARKASKGKNDNRENIKKLVSLRIARAKLLGFKTHANYVLEERMAQSESRVLSFLDYLREKAYPVALKELQELKDYIKKSGFDFRLERWDFAYWSEKLKLEKYAINDEVLRPYFKLENVVDGVFDVAKRLYGLNFKKLNNTPIYHQEVEVYEVLNSEYKHVGIFFMDLFPRSGKRGGAWMTVFREQGLMEGSVQRPQVAIVCNFTRPTKEKPSLLSLQEVLTLFHEFGHALHGLLSECTYRSIAGTNVYWDFVELPSQILENWVYEKECLDLFASHFETGDKIPFDIVKKIQDSSKFQEGISTLRQLTFAYLDMCWHTLDSLTETDVYKFEKQAVEKVSIFPEIEGAIQSCSFSHIFSGGYSSGYYSYKWAEVLDADAFEYFKEQGIFNKEVALKFKENILSKGSSEHPMDLYRKFRGKEPSPDALLRRGGLL